MDYGCNTTANNFGIAAFKMVGEIYVIFYADIVGVGWNKNPRAWKNFIAQAVIGHIQSHIYFRNRNVPSCPGFGWVARKFGVVFIDRRPSHALDALAQVRDTLNTVSYPVFLFPEGTTTNGAYVKPFKSTLFNFVENSNVVVQPLVMNYRFRDGSPISDADMAEHFAYFNNSNQDMGPACSRERSAFGQVFHIMMLGGFMVELTVLPPPPLAGMDRKQIAETLHKTVSDKYMELKNKHAK